MNASGITGNMVVKNEDQWVWYAIQSVLPYVDTLLITDTGSSDNTVDIISSIKSDKIIFSQTITQTRSDIAAIRQNQLDQTKTPWIWIVDGDEVYPNSLAEEIVEATGDSKYQLVVVRRHDLLGDIYHKQVETVGSYNMYGQKGHLLVRLLKKDTLPSLIVKGDYPLEGYHANNMSIENIAPSKVYITKESLYHAMYLNRSSRGETMFSPVTFNRSKYKIETGIPVNGNMPEVFSLAHPSNVPDAKKARGFKYNFAASILTPIKKLKRYAI